MKKKIKKSVKVVYGMLRDVLGLYEATEGYNNAPAGVEEDCQTYLENVLSEIRNEIYCRFLGKEKMQAKLLRIVDETEIFLRNCEQPGVVSRWKKINPNMLFFEPAFELMEEVPDFYREICWGVSPIRLDCYPDENLIFLRNLYFERIKEENQRNNLKYSDDRVFQEELQRTLTLVFENDFGD